MVMVGLRPPALIMRFSKRGECLGPNEECPGPHTGSLVLTQDRQLFCGVKRGGFLIPQAPSVREAGLLLEGRAQIVCS